ncbi:MAG: hypothetical protein ABEI75_02925 [Halobaculum sp.]
MTRSDLLDRRAVLAAVGAAAVGSVAGCTGGGGGAPPTDDTETPTPTATETETAPSETATPTVLDTYVTGSSLERLPDCSAGEAGTATVTFANPLTVEGCIQGRNGCVVPALADVSVVEGRTLRVTVETAEEGGVCSQQIVYRGYRVSVQYLDAQPETVVVRHRSMDETRTVATVTPG